MYRSGLGSIYQWKYSPLLDMEGQLLHHHPQQRCYYCDSLLQHWSYSSTGECTPQQQGWIEAHRLARLRRKHTDDSELGPWSAMGGNGIPVGKLANNPPARNCGGAPCHIPDRGA